MMMESETSLIKARSSLHKLILGDWSEVGTVYLTFSSGEFMHAGYRETSRLKVMRDPKRLRL